MFRNADWLTGERAWRWASIFAVVAVCGMAYDLWTHSGAAMVGPDGERLGRDFVNYWAGARLGAQGQAALAYDPRAYQHVLAAWAGPEPAMRIYSYPPSLMLVTLPLAALGFAPGLVAWSLAGVAACAAALSRLASSRWAALAAVGAPASFLNLVSGQNGVLSAVCLCGGLIALPSRPVLAGLLFGALSYKPQLGLLIPVALAAGGHWRAFVAAAASALVLSGASALAFGLEPWRGFFELAPIQRAMMEIGVDFWRRMPTVFAMARLAGGSVALAYLAQAVSALAALAAIVWLWRAPAPHAVKAAGLAIATFLVSPYAWDYDMVILLFAVAWLAREAAATGFAPWEKAAFAALAALPLAQMLIGAATPLQPAPLLLWACFGLLLRRAVAATQPAPSPHVASASLSG